MGEASCTIRDRVIKAREIQLQRFESHIGVYNNAQMGSSLLKSIVSLNKASALLLKIAMERLQLSARAYDRILKLSRTIADLSSSSTVEPEHVAEAIQYRSLDREGWGIK
jgi:magnesium chelatase family protein